MIKIILDTNVLIDAMNDNFSYTWKILDLVIKGELRALVADKIIKEYRLIMKRRIKRTEDKEKLENFIARVEVVPAGRKLNVIPDDPEDEKFLECAQANGVEFIISSDVHLLNLEEYQGIKIVSPKDFWFWYQSKKPSTDDEWKETFKNILGI